MFRRVEVKDGETFTAVAARLKLTIPSGHGFRPVTKNEKINEAHELVLYNADGTCEVEGVRSKLQKGKPSEMISVASIPKGSELYVQSKSYNRKLSAGAVLIKGKEGGGSSAPGTKKGTATKKAAAASRQPPRRRPAAKDEEENDSSSSSSSSEEEDTSPAPPARGRGKKVAAAAKKTSAAAKRAAYKSPERKDKAELTPTKKIRAPIKESGNRDNEDLADSAVAPTPCVTCGCTCGGRKNAVVAEEEGATNTSARQGKRKTRDDEMNNMPSASKRGPAPGTVAKMTHEKLPVEIIASVLAVGPLDLNLLQASLLVSKSWRQATESAMQLRARALLKLDGPGAASISKVIGSYEESLRQLMNAGRLLKRTDIKMSATGGILAKEADRLSALAVETESCVDAARVALLNSAIRLKLLGRYTDNDKADDEGDAAFEKCDVAAVKADFERINIFDNTDSHIRIRNMYAHFLLFNKETSKGVEFQVISCFTYAHSGTADFTLKARVDVKLPNQSIWQTLLQRPQTEWFDTTVYDTFIDKRDEVDPEDEDDFELMDQLGDDFTEEEYAAAATPSRIISTRKPGDPKEFNDEDRPESKRPGWSQRLLKDVSKVLDVTDSLALWEKMLSSVVTGIMKEISVRSLVKPTWIESAKSKSEFFSRVCSLGRKELDNEEQGDDGDDSDEDNEHDDDDDCGECAPETTNRHLLHLAQVINARANAAAQIARWLSGNKTKGQLVPTFVKRNKPKSLIELQNNTVVTRIMDQSVAAKREAGFCAFAQHITLLIFPKASASGSSDDDNDDADEDSNKPVMLSYSYTTALKESESSLIFKTSHPDLEDLIESLELEPDDIIVDLHFDADKSLECVGFDEIDAHTLYELILLYSSMWHFVAKSGKDTIVLAKDSEERGTKWVVSLLEKKIESVFGGNSGMVEFGNSNAFYPE